MSHASSPPHRCDVCDPNSQSTNNDQFLTTSSLTTSTASTATTILSSSSTNQFKQNVANFSDSNHHHHNNHSSYHHFPNNNGASINGIDQTSITNRISNTIISNDGKWYDLILRDQYFAFANKFFFLILAARFRLKPTMISFLNHNFIHQYLEMNHHVRHCPWQKIHQPF